MRRYLAGTRARLSQYGALLPEVVFGEMLFNIAFWMALLVMALATLLSPIPLVPTQAAVVMVVLGALFAYNQAARRRLPPAVLKVGLTAVDAIAALAIFALTVSTGPGAHSLLFFAVAGMAARFRRALGLIGGMLLAVPFAMLSGGGAAGIVLEAFTVVALMGAVQFVLFMADRGRSSAQLNASLLTVASSLARAHDDDAICERLIHLVAPFAPQATWIVWRWDTELQAFRPARCYGVPLGHTPLAYWSIAEAQNQFGLMELEGVVPFREGSGDTLIQPLQSGGVLLGLVSATGSRSDWTLALRAVLSGIADEAGVALGRAHLLAEERTRAVELEMLNAIARDVALSESPVDALHSVGCQLARLVAFDSLYLSLLSPNGLALVAGPGDPIAAFLPEEMPVDRTRTHEVCARGCAINEAVSDARWRPEDAWWAAAGVTSVLAVPLTFPGSVLGALHVGRRDTVAFNVRERHLVESVAAHLAAALSHSRSGDLERLPLVPSVEATS
jgi:GAF domain-containing protein